MGRRSKFIVVAFVVAVGLAAAAHLAYSSVVDARNRQQLQELTTRTLARAEVAIDLAIIKMGDLLAEGRTNCSAETIAAIRKTVFSVGSLKDIKVLLPGQDCRAFADYGTGLSDQRTATHRRPARNPAFALTPIGNEDWSGLGVVWRFAEGSEFFAVMSTDSLVFDMLPRQLREDATVALTLGDENIAAYKPSRWEEIGLKSNTIFREESSRYPIAARIVVDDTTLAAWNKTIPPEIVAMMLVFVVTSGLLAAKGLVRPPHPAEDLDFAIASGEISPHFQPIVALSGQHIVGCEMLARWVRADGTSVSPQRFVALAEMWGRADSLMEALLIQAGRSIGPALAVRPDFKFSFNVTPAQFLADGFAARLQKLAVDNGLRQNQLVIELTERQEITSIEAAAKVTAALNSSGIRVAVDDTGTGHNGLAVVKGLRASCMKIDKVFIDGLDTDPRARTLVEMLVNVAREFCMTVVAEGIESTEEVAILLSLGVHEGQGFLFSPALPADAFLALLETGFASEPTRKLPNLPPSSVVGECAA